jgi:hypothetical protein
VAALSGYRLEVVSDADANARDALRRIADAAPELIVFWVPQISDRSFMARVSALQIDAEIAEVDLPSDAEALEEARAWFAAAPVIVRGDADREVPTNLVDAAKRARDACTRVVVTDQAIHRAKSSIYENPGEVLQALLDLDRIGERWASDEIEMADFEQACGDAGLLFSRDISPETRARHGTRYRVTIDDVTHDMGPHFRFGGSWNPRYCARVYWWTDIDSRRFIVGHIGEHLPGSKDQTLVRASEASI